MSETSPAFERDTAAPLRRDIRLLGTILGRVLVEQEGPWLLELVETIRRSAREARSHGPADVAGALTETEPHAQTLVLRAFGLYFQLANLAEQHHRLRRRREDAHDGRVSRESLDDAFGRLGAVSAEELAARAAGTAIRLVLTAHPTETTRRSVLLSHIRIERELVELDDARVSPAERHAAEERIAEEVTLLWQTDEVRHGRLRVSDEIRHALWFFEHSLMSAATDLVGAWRERLPGTPSPAHVRLVGRRRHGRQPRGRACVDRRGARQSADAGARPLPRGGPLARGRDRRVTLARGRIRGARALAAARRGRAAGVRERDRRAQRGRALPAQALVHVVAARQRRVPQPRRSCSPISA